MATGISRTYVLISGVLFELIALVHLLRALLGWDLILGTWAAPMAFSWGGFVIMELLAIWAFRQYTQK